MRGSPVRRFIRQPMNLPFLDELSHWVGRSDLFSISLISGILIWTRYMHVSFDQFYQLMTTSFNFESMDKHQASDTFTSSLIEHLPRYLSERILKHGTATISMVYCLLFMSFLLFSSPVYELRYLRNKEFTGYSFLIYFIYCWLFISMLSHAPIIHQLVETPLALFPYFYGLTVLSVSTINVTFRIILNRIFVFHTGLRKRFFEILQSSAFVSLACSTLYANCGNTFEIFELNASNKQSVKFELDGSVLFCQKLFETVALSGNEHYYQIPPVLTMWLTFVSIMCVNYIIEGTASDRFIFFSASDFEVTEYIEHEVVTMSNDTQSQPSSVLQTPSQSAPSLDISDDDDSGIKSVVESQSFEPLITSQPLIRRIIHSAEPRDVHPMTSWFAMGIVVVCIDMVIALGIFLDRYDRREMNNSLAVLKSIMDKKMRKKKKNVSSHSLESLNPPTVLTFSPIKNISWNRENPSKLTDNQQCNASCFGYLQHNTEIWFDFMADCGDGFHPGYEIARLLAQPYLIGTNDIKLKRGKLLLIGGDLAYPRPSHRNYQKKFFRVFEDAMRPPEEALSKPTEIAYNKPELPFSSTLSSYEGPTCLIIPGNHDWFDGLETYGRFICNRNWLGGWYLPQTSSYFVQALPHHWWIFAADFALNNDIDTKQFQYFAKVVETYFDGETRLERVIIITHMPDWIINNHQQCSYGQNLQYLISNIIGADRIRLRLAGDIHNYTRHEALSVIRAGLRPNPNKRKGERDEDDDGYKTPHQDIPLRSDYNLKRSASMGNFQYREQNAPTLMVSGGGGAFLHPTHIPEPKPIDVNGIIYDRVSEYPSILQSKAYAFFNIFGFRKRNLQFDLLGGILYYLMVSSLFPLCKLDINSHVEELTFSKLVFKFQQIFMMGTFEIFEHSYISITVVCLGLVGMYLWTESHLSFKFRIFIAITHMIAHYAASMTVIILMEMIIEASFENELIGIKKPYETFQTHFQKTHEVLQHVDHHYTFGCITSVLQVLFTVIDIAGFHVSLRQVICESEYKQYHLIFKDIPIETWFKLDYDLLPSRFTRLAYHFTAFLGYFIFAAPVVSFVVGLYLFLSAKCGKYDEVFSSLRLDKHKNFVRFHLRCDGSLQVYVIGVDKVPHRWRQDPQWDGRGTLLSIPNNESNEDDDVNDTICNRLLTPSPNKHKSNHRRNSTSMMDTSDAINARDMRHLGPSHTWKFPSRWISYNSSGDTNMSSKHKYRRVKIIDQFVLH
eukprot:252429_1